MRAASPFGLLVVLVLGAAAALPAQPPAAAAPATPAAPAPAARADGLWQGSVDHLPGQIEWDLGVELATAADGRLVGTLDIPVQRMKLHPLDHLSVDGNKVNFEFERLPGQQVPENRFRLEGTLSPDGQTLSGFFLGRIQGVDLHSPFVLRRIGDAGAERPKSAAAARPVVALSARGDELRAAFNRDQGKLRLVILLSPTCGSCLNGAHVVEKYVLDAIHDDSLRVYVVWGPMQGDEHRDDAAPATVFLADPRAAHFWTDGQEVAALFARAGKLPAGDRAWESLELFAPGATWGDALPAPVHVWRIDRPEPGDFALNGPHVAQQVCAALPGCKL
jgi:hypothetical protein